MTSSVDSPWVVIALAGELDISLADHLEEMVRPALDGNDGNVIIDLSDVTFVDSATLNWLLKTQDRVDRIGGELRVVTPEDGSLVRLLSLTGLDGRFALFPNRMIAERSSTLLEGFEASNGASPGSAVAQADLSGGRLSG